MSLKTRTIAFFSVLALGVPAVAAACPDEPVTPTSDGTVNAEDAPAEYTIEATAVPVKAGTQGFAIVTIKTQGGYHWNKEYPAKATVATSGDSIGVDKTEFKQTSGDFQAEETVATLKIPVNGKSAGEGTVTVDTRFGLCTDQVCLIKKASANVTVVVAD